MDGNRLKIVIVFNQNIQEIRIGGLGSLPPGMYWYFVEKDGVHFSGKLIKNLF